MKIRIFEDVYQFMDAFDQLPATANTTELYRKLVKEEYTELFDAVEQNDEVEEFDACLDLIWVVVGYMHSRGWDVEGGWSEVARSNFAKLDPVTGKAIHREDGKVVKPKGWTPPNLTPFLKKESL